MATLNNDMLVRATTTGDYEQCVQSMVSTIVPIQKKYHQQPYDLEQLTKFECRVRAEFKDYNSDQRACRVRSQLQALRWSPS
jgi:hypothetical protein